MLVIKNTEMDQTASPNAVFRYVSDHCTMPKPKLSIFRHRSLFHYLHLLWRSYDSLKTYSSAAPSVPQVHRCASLYAENKAALALGWWDAHRSITTSQTLLTCCAAMVQFILWVIKCHIHLAVNCKRGGLDSAYRWIPKYRRHTQMFTCE